MLTPVRERTLSAPEVRHFEWSFFSHNKKLTPPVGCFVQKLYRLFQTQHSFSVTSFCPRLSPFFFNKKRGKKFFFFQEREVKKREAVEIPAKQTNRAKGSLFFFPCVYLQQNKKKAKAESKNCHAKTMLSLEKPIKLI